MDTQERSEHAHRSSSWPRRILGGLSRRLGLVLILFGAALLVVGGSVQATRWWRVTRAERLAAPPDYAASLAPGAPWAAEGAAGDGPGGSLAVGDAGTRDPSAGGALAAPAAPASASVDAPPSASEMVDPKEATVAAALAIQRAAPATSPVTSPAAAAATALPQRIVIPAIELDKPVVEIGWQQELVDNDTLRSVWQTASGAAGFHRGSAPMGRPGNTVISAHNNIDGAVFARLHELEPGDRVRLYGPEGGREYEVWTNFVVREEGVPLEQRKRNAEWIGPSPDERLTLVTCYPPWGNSHRTIVVAQPVGAVAAHAQEVPDAGTTGP